MAFTSDQERKLAAFADAMTDEFVDLLPTVISILLAPAPILNPTALAVLGGVIAVGIRTHNKDLVAAMRQRLQQEATAMLQEIQQNDVQPAINEYNTAQSAINSGLNALDTLIAEMQGAQDPVIPTEEEMRTLMGLPPAS